MKFSAPIHVLKQQARVSARQKKIPLHEALDRIAKEEGFDSWSLLAARWGNDKTTASLLAQLRLGELLLLAGRPGQGKTLVGLGLVAEWMARGNRAAIFTFELTKADVSRCLGAMGTDTKGFRDRLIVDDSDAINADYIIASLGVAPRNTLILIDYLQLLDQRRENPGLMTQVAQLKQFARQHRAIIVCLSQVHRSYDPAIRPLPALRDIRLPNPLDLKLFDKACFMGQRRMQVGVVT